MGIGDAGRDVARHVAALASARLELASLEWATERERILRGLATMLAGVLLLVLGMFTLMGLVILYFWESHRMAALLGTGLLCIVSGGWLILRPGTTEGDGGLPFAATRAEFDKDRATFFAEDRAFADDTARPAEDPAAGTASSAPLQRPAT